MRALADLPAKEVLDTVGADAKFQDVDHAVIIGPVAGASS
jgi:hypothetical protein